MQIYPSDYITRLYINSQYPSLKRLLVVGAPSLLAEIEKTGKQVVHINDIVPEGSINPEMIKQGIDPLIDGVVMGYDNTLNYNKIVLISVYVQLGAAFIGTNPDKYTMVSGLKMPGCGSMIRCIEEATSRKADIAGKPSPFIIEFLLGEEKLKREECLMIGDNLDTDIAFGKRGGIDTLCVLSGVSTEEMVVGSQEPCYYAEYLL